MFKVIGHENCKSDHIQCATCQLGSHDQLVLCYMIPKICPLTKSKKSLFLKYNQNTMEDLQYKETFIIKVEETASYFDTVPSNCVAKNDLYSK